MLAINALMCCQITQPSTHKIIMTYTQSLKYHSENIRCGDRCPLPSHDTSHSCICGKCSASTHCNTANPDKCRTAQSPNIREKCTQQSPTSPLQAPPAEYSRGYLPTTACNRRYIITISLTEFTSPPHIQRARCRIQRAENSRRGRRAEHREIYTKANTLGYCNIGPISLTNHYKYICK